MFRGAPRRTSAGDLKKRTQTRRIIGQPQARPWDVDVRGVISQNVDGFGRTSACILAHPRASGCILAHHQNGIWTNEPKLTAREGASGPVRVNFAGIDGIIFGPDWSIDAKQ